jgi:hypothetical protein
MITARFVHARVAFTTLALLTATVWIDAQATPPVKNGTKTTGTQTQTANPSPAAPPQILRVTINSSRVSVTRDGSYGVYADLENVSSDVVTIYPQETLLVVQPEVAFPTACVGLEQGIFPAQPFSANTSNSGKLPIQPGEHYKVFWNLANDPVKVGQGRCAVGSWRKGLREYLGFVPGEYAFSVEGVVYTPELKGGTPVAHTYTETTSLNVGLSQASTAIAAFFGALLAYLVVAIQPGRDFDKWRAGSALPSPPTGGGGPEVPPDRMQKATTVASRIHGWLRSLLVVVRNALAAGLLGAALTIVASRLSDTQFPIKVSVNDFWGALTIGFVSYFIGSRLLTTIISKLAPETPSPQPGGENTGGPQVQTSGGAPPKDSPATDSDKPKEEPAANDVHVLIDDPVESTAPTTAQGRLDAGAAEEWTPQQAFGRS